MTERFDNVIKEIRLIKHEKCIDSIFFEIHKCFRTFVASVKEFTYKIHLHLHLQKIVKVECTYFVLQSILM